MKLIAETAPTILQPIHYVRTKNGLRLVHTLPHGSKKDIHLMYNSISKSIDMKISTPQQFSPPHGDTHADSLGKGRASILLGMFKAGSIQYVGLVTKSSCCEHLSYAMKVEEVKFVPINGAAPSDMAGHHLPLTAYDQRELDLLYSSFYRHTFFYARQPLSHDITRTTQGNAQLKSFYKRRSGDSVTELLPSSFRDCDSRFFWNRNTLQPIIQAVQHQNFDEVVIEDILNTWITPVMSAALTFFPFEVSHGHHYTLSLMSRRSWARQGPRLRVRGIDNSGDVANFVETEQILTNVDTKDIASFVQVRGSIPLFWQQPDRFAPKPPIVIDKDDTTFLEHAEALSAHLKDLHQRYVLQYQHDTTKYANPADSVDQKASRSHIPAIIVLNLIDKLNSQGSIGRYMMRVLDRLATGSTNTTIREEESVLNRNNVTMSNYLMTLAKSNAKANQSLSSLLTPFMKTLNHITEVPENNAIMKLRHVWYDFHFHHQRTSLTSLQPSSSPTRNIVRPLSDLLQSDTSFYLSAVPAHASSEQKSSAQTENLHSSPSLSCAHTQTNIIRTNCVDSLDRTNVAQVDNTCNCVDHVHVLGSMYYMMSHHIKWYPRQTFILSHFDAFFMLCEILLQSEIARFVLLRQLKLLDPTALSVDCTGEATADPHIRDGESDLCMVSLPPVRDNVKSHSFVYCATVCSIFFMTIIHEQIVNYYSLCSIVQYACSISNNHSESYGASMGTKLACSMLERGNNFTVHWSLVYPACGFFSI